MKYPTTAIQLVKISNSSKDQNSPNYVSVQRPRERSSYDEIVIEEQFDSKIRQGEDVHVQIARPRAIWNSLIRTRRNCPVEVSFYFAAKGQDKLLSLPTTFVSRWQRRNVSSAPRSWFLTWASKFYRAWTKYVRRIEIERRRAGEVVVSRYYGFSHGFLNRRAEWSSSKRISVAGDYRGSGEGGGEGDEGEEKGRRGSVAFDQGEKCELVARVELPSPSTTRFLNFSASEWLVFPANPAATLNDARLC